MTSIWKKALVLLLLASAACARDGANKIADAGNARTNMAAEAPGRAHAPSADATNPAGGGQAAGAATTTGSILAWSRPAAGSAISAPFNELVLHFSPPARLDEVTVMGPEGSMPMMVTAIGEVDHYSLPLQADAPGSYSVAWRASSQGREYQGRFGFTIR